MAEPGRSWTDPLTNTTVFADLALEEHLPQLLDWGAAPPEIAPAFMHEATHHWCFDSPVGYALSLLHMRSRRAALRYAEQSGGHDLAHAVAEDVNRYETAAAFMRPLAEGIALFAEFDSVTRQDSKVFSTPLDQATWFFVGPALDPSGVSENMFISALTGKVLQPMRMSGQVLARKVSLLGQPLTCQGDAYLPGYLLIRGLWRSAAQNVGRLLNETDLFLMYLRSFLYDDYGLIAELLDTSKDEIRGAEAVANQITGRLGQFEEVTPEDVESFEDAVLAGDVEARLASIHLDPADYAAGRQRLSEALQWYEEPGSESVMAITQMHARLLSRRHLLYLGSWRAEVEVAGSTFRVLGESGVVREGAAVEGVPSGRSQGSVDVVYWHKRRTSACIVTRDRTLVATQSFSPAQHDNDPEVLEVAAERDEARQLLSALEEMVESVVQNSWVSIARRHVRDETARLIDSVYLPPALPRVPDARLEATTAALRDRGFFRVLDRDRQLIEGFAQVGLLCSVVLPHEAMLRPLFEQRGFDLDRTIAAGNALEERYGVGRILVADGYILPDV